MNIHICCCSGFPRFWHIPRAPKNWGFAGFMATGQSPTSFELETCFARSQRVFFIPSFLCQSTLRPYSLLYSLLWMVVKKAYSTVCDKEKVWKKLTKEVLQTKWWSEKYNIFSTFMQVMYRWVNWGLPKFEIEIISCVQIRLALSRTQRFGTAVSRTWLCDVLVRPWKNCSCD